MTFRPLQSTRAEVRKLAARDGLTETAAVYRLLSLGLARARNGRSLTDVEEC